MEFLHCLSVRYYYFGIEKYYFNWVVIIHFRCQKIINKISRNMFEKLSFTMRHT